MYHTTKVFKLEKESIKKNSPKLGSINPITKITVSIKRQISKERKGNDAKSKRKDKLADPKTENQGENVQGSST